MKQIESILKTFLLKLLLLFYSKNNNENINSEFTSESNILFIRLNRIGDALVTTPLIKLIKQTYNCNVFLLADRKNSFVFENNPFINEIFVFPKGLKGFSFYKNLLAEKNIDTVVDLHDDVSTTVSFLMAMSKVNNKFGLEKDNSIVYTKTVERIKSSSYHVVDRCLEISKLFGISEPNYDELNIVYQINDNSENEASKFIKGIKSDKKLIGINISAGSDARFWGVDNYKKIVTLLVSKNYDILILTAPKDVHHAKNISEDKVPIFYSKDFNKFAAVIGKLDLLFTPDTSVVHIASMFRVPLFGIYVKYKTDDIIWYPYKSRYDAVTTEDPNFKNLDYNIVEQKFIKLIEKIKDEKNNS